MDLRQLNALRAVAEHGSFSAAARALHTVQSNVSTHVARLERELDTTLVDRATGLLTEQGQVVTERARRIQAELDAMLSDVVSLNAQVTGTARVGIIGTTARWIAPLLIDALTTEHPHVELVIVDATTSSLLPQLKAGGLDVAVLNLPVDDPDVDTDELFHEDRVLVAPAEHHLATRDELTLGDLDGEPLLLEPRGTSFRDELDRLAAEVGCELRSQAEVDGMRLLASLAFQGFGAALLPASAAPSWVGGEWRRIPVRGLAGRTVGLATRRHGLLSAAGRAAADAVRHVVRDSGAAQNGIHPLAGV